MLRLQLFAGLLSGVLLLLGSHAPGQSGSAPKCAPDYSGDRYTLRGRVFAEGTGIVIDYANIVVTEESQGTVCGAMSLDGGAYAIDLPPGTYTLKCLVIGYRPLEVPGIVVAPGDEVTADCALVLLGLTLAEAEAESLGADLDPNDLEMHLEIASDRDEYIVGGEVGLAIAIHNRSDQVVYLPEIMDDSCSGDRFPIVDLEIKGPPKGVVYAKPVSWCGWTNRFRTDHLHPVLPGGVFHPTPSGRVFPLRVFGVEFLEPGTYVVTMRFRMDEPDLREWWGSMNSGPVPLELSRRLRSVPLVDLVGRCEVVVR